VPSILVADDSRPFAELIRVSLEEAGYEVITAHTGLAAVAAVEHNDVALAVLDVLMPGMSGDVVAERLHLVVPQLPIVLMTGADQAFAATSGLHVLRKPFPHEELLEIVRRLLAEA
jgi:CheY-like chemotaxis protein